MERTFARPLPPGGIQALLDRENRRTDPRQTVFSIEDYSPQEEIDQAREILLADARRNAEPIVERLMYTYLGNRKMPKDAAIQFLREIGPSATPALLNGIKRGDQYLANDCRQCLTD